MGLDQWASDLPTGGQVDRAGGSVEQWGRGVDEAKPDDPGRSVEQYGRSVLDYGKKGPTHEGSETLLVVGLVIILAAVWLVWQASKGGAGAWLADLVTPLRNATTGVDGAKLDSGYVFAFQFAIVVALGWCSWSGLVTTFQLARALGRIKVIGILAVATFLTWWSLAAISTYYATRSTLGWYVVLGIQLGHMARRVTVERREQRT